MTLLELAERCEQATGPDRELDGSIASLLSGHEVHRVTVGPDHRREEWVFIGIDAGHAAPTSRPVPRYTASLDAAMTLLGAGCEIDMTDLYGVARANVDMANDYGGHHGSNESGSLPLALCAAALKARAAHHPRNSHDREADFIARAYPALRAGPR